MPYKDPERKRQWEREHREERNARRRKSISSRSPEPSSIDAPLTDPNSVQTPLTSGLSRGSRYQSSHVVAATGKKLWSRESCMSSLHGIASQFSQ
jgi:hypothetical protein